MCVAMLIVRGIDQAGIAGYAKGVVVMLFVTPVKPVDRKLGTDAAARRQQADREFARFKARHGSFAQYARPPI